MRSLVVDNVGKPLLKSLWLGRLPNGTQTILAALNENLGQLATVADKINDLTFPQGINSVAATSNHNTEPLEQQIAQQVSELTSFMNRSRSPARNLKHVHNRSEAQVPLNKLLTNCKKNDKRPVSWNEADIAFMQCKSSLGNAATLAYPTPDQ
ncbi:uncharacterized protein NPIL_505091 [Nephila pilipes]|uniref:Uncharacterized protein n=1 Tax=Nephila pilipes TaxID=299642 RepID=A0A8X6QYL4_NEPPI|nr:uncharacterized protein NPIL_505091 [Nephila pilipes]